MFIIVDSCGVHENELLPREANVKKRSFKNIWPQNMRFNWIESRLINSAFQMYGPGCLALSKDGNGFVERFRFGFASVLQESRFHFIGSKREPVAIRSVPLASVPHQNRNPTRTAVPYIQMKQTLHFYLFLTTFYFGDISFGCDGWMFVSKILDTKQHQVTP